MESQDYRLSRVSSLSRRSSRKTVVTEPRSPFADIEDGQLISTEVMQTIKNSEYGIPLPESEKTFVVVGRELPFSKPKSLPQRTGKLYRFSNTPALFIFKSEHLLRRFALYTYTHPTFESIILLTIFLNAIYMSFNNDCAVAEYTFISVYTVEAMVKVLARGFVTHKHSYLADWWNWLDLIVLCSSYAVFIIQLVGISGSSGVNLQALRTLRLLRMVTILPGLQAIVKALFLSIRRLAGVLAFVTFFILVFALFGIELFSGDLRNKCVADFDIKNNSTRVTRAMWANWSSESKNWALNNFADYRLCGNVYGAQKCPTGYRCSLVASSPNPMYGYFSFDNFVLAIIAVVIVITGDYWEEEFRIVLSTNGPWASVYFVAVVLFGAFYLMNLILSVVALSYSADSVDTNQPEGDTQQLDEENDDEHKDIENRRDSVKSTNEKIASCCKKGRLNTKKFVESTYFDIFTTIVIVINTLAMAVVHHGMPQWLSEAVDVISNVCASIFVVEAVLKILAFGRSYFSNKWNLLDFFVVVGSIIDAISTYGLHSQTSLNTSAIRLLRLLRILKLAQSWETMRILLEIIFRTMTSLANLTVILGCIVFIFALVGVQLFDGTYTSEMFGPSLPRWNFDGLMRSLMTIFRILCRDAVEPMITCFRANGMGVCMPVFLGTLVIGTFVVLNLFLALLLSGFSSEDLKKSKSQTAETSWISKKIIKIKEKFFPNSANNRRTSQVSKSISKIRQKLRAVCEHQAFEGVVLIMIFGSSILLCLYDVYLQEGSILAYALTICDYVFLALFTFEFLLKLFAYGFRKYFSQFWTYLDFIVLLTGYVDIILTYFSASKSSNLLALRCLRCLRCLRPLRAISRWEGMRVVVNALVRTIPGIGNVLLVVMVFWLVFSIVGVQFFAGKFARCIDVETGDRLPVALIPNREACEQLPANKTPIRRWMNPTINFDNVFSGYLALLQIATFESWTEIFEAAVDVPDVVGQQPSREQSFSYAVYFIVFIVFGSFFLLNLFIGVIVESFSELKKELEMSAIAMLLTENQLQYYRLIKAVENRQPRKLVSMSKNRFQVILFKISVAPLFDGIMVSIILLSCVTLATEHFGQPELLTQVQEIINLVCTIIFALEAIIKVAGLRIHYFREAWNVFDLTLVVWSLAMLAVDVNSSSVKSVRASALLRALRVLRIGRLIRLVRSMSSVRALILSLARSLPALFNVGCLLALIIFIYSVCGMILFGRIRHQGVINDIVNFETFGNSYLLLFRLCTMAGWDGVLAAMSLQSSHHEKGGCDPDFWISPVTGNKTQSLGGNCGYPVVSAVYLSSFLIVSNFVLTNIFVAIILENLEVATQQARQQTTDDDTGDAVIRLSDDTDEESVVIPDKDIDNFFVTWIKFDHFVTQYMPLDNLSQFLNQLVGSFHFKVPNRSVIALMNIPVLNDGIGGEELIHCGDVLLALIQIRSLGIVSRTSKEDALRPRQSRLIKPREETRVAESGAKSHLGQIVSATELQRKVFSQWKSTWTKNERMQVSSTLERRQQEASAVVVQRAWRRCYNRISQ